MPPPPMSSTPIVNHVETSFADQMQILNTSSLVDDTGMHTAYYMNRDGCMETATTSEGLAMAAAAGSVPLSAVPPPPPLGNLKFDAQN